MNSKLILASVIMFSSSFAFADYPKKTIYDCKVFGSDLDQVTAKAAIQIVEIEYPNDPGLFIHLDYSSEFDGVLGTTYNVPSVSLPVQNAKKNLARYSHFHTVKEHRFTRWDDFFVIINLKRKASVVVDQQKFTGFKATVGFNTSLRYIEADAVCAKM